MKFLCPEERDTNGQKKETYQNLLFLIEVNFIWTALCQEGIKLCVGLLWCLWKTLGTESTVCLCSQQQFADPTANTVAERDWISR